MNSDDLRKIKILNIAWVGQGDFGDEAMAYALRCFLKRNGADSITYYQHGKYSHYRSKDDLKIDYLHKFEGRGWKRCLFDNVLLKKFNALIIGGGSVLHSQENIRWKYEILKKIKKSKKQVFSANVGVSLGPFRSEKDFDICREYLDAVDVSIFRDKWSADLAGEISKNKNIFASLDNTLLLPAICQEEMHQAKNVKRDSDLVGIFFVERYNWTDSSERMKKYSAIINDVLARGKRIILFNFYLGDVFHDAELAKLLKEKSRFPDRVEIYTFDGDIFASIGQMARCEKIISMRLHGIIFAYMLGIPFLSLEYDQKNRNFCDSICYPKEMTFDFNSLKDINLIFNSLNHLFEREQEIFKGVLPKEKAVEIVGKNFNFLLKQMEEKLL